MKRILLSLWALMLAFTSIADTPNIVLNKPVGGSAITIRIAVSSANTTGTIDWGNGSAVPINNGNTISTTQTMGGSTQINGTVVGDGAVKIYTSNITYLYLQNLGLTGIDITNCPTLKSFDASKNSISTIDLSNNTELTYIGVHTNNLSSIDISASTKATSIILNNNSLSSIDLSKNTLLNTLNLAVNSFSSLDLLKNIKLTNVTINNNQFSAVALNQIFTDLPTPVTAGTLKITGNSGASTSATSIAVAKNWAVDVIGDGSSLPLTLLSFTGELKNNIQNTVSLNWKTAEEVNTKQFIIERAASDGVFNEIGKTDAQNISGINTYSYTDNNPLADVSYYRLKQTDIDGAFTYSNVIKIENSNELSVNVYPVPVKDGKLFVQYPAVQDKNAVIAIYSLTGKKVFSTGPELNSVTSSIEVSGLASGNYILSYKSGNQTISKKIVIQ